MKLTFVVFAAICLGLAAAQKQIPTVPDEYAAVVEINRPYGCIDSRLGCPSTETFHEFRSYFMNAIRVVHNEEDQAFYYFNYHSAHFIKGFNCTTFNVSAGAAHHHGSFIFSAYDPTINHVTHSNDMYLISSGNPQYRGQNQVRGIYTDYWTGSASVTVDNQPVTVNLEWHFSAANWTFYSLGTSVTTIPVRFIVSGTITENGAPVQFYEVHDFTDFIPGRLDFQSLMLPEHIFCPWLLQQPIPTMPNQVSYTIEMNDVTLQQTFSGRFYFDYDLNTLRIERWINDANSISIIDVTNLVNTTFSWHQSCTAQTVPQNAPNEWVDHLIDFTVSPPHLLPPTETVGHRDNTPTNWLFAGYRPVRDINAQVWFVQRNLSHIPTPHGYFSMFETVAWYFTAPDWTVVGLPGQQAYPIRVTRIGAFLNSTSGRWDFFSTNREFSDVKVGLEPRTFELPPFCPGGIPLQCSSSGLSSGGAAGLAIGMIILGAILGAFALHYFGNRSGKRMNLQASDGENVGLSTGSSYGTA